MGRAGSRVRCAFGTRLEVKGAVIDMKRAIRGELARYRDDCRFSPRASRTASVYGIARATLLALLMTASGCVDTRQKLEDFQQRYERTHEAGVGGGNTCQPGLPAANELAGDYLLAVSAAFSSKKPIVFVATVEASAAPPDQLRFSFDLQPLSATDRRTPVGGSTGRAETTAGVPFTLDFGQVTVTGEADPILPGRPIVAVITLGGELCAPDPATGSVEFLCGAVSGTVSEPTALNLEGSTWTARRIQDANSLPEITINCAGDPPDPL